MNGFTRSHFIVNADTDDSHPLKQHEKLHRVQNLEKLRLPYMVVNRCFLLCIISYLLTSVINGITMHIISQEGRQANRELPNGEDDRLWEDSNP